MDKAGKSRFLETLEKRPIIGDGSYVFTLEKRGYVCGGAWTPECVVEQPDAVKQLHSEFIWAGADCIQAFSFYATDGKLKASKNAKKYTSADINSAASKIAREVVAAATNPDLFICGGVSPTPSYSRNKDIEAAKEDFRRQVEIFTNDKFDFLLGEFFGHTEEACLAIEMMKTSGLPVACTMRIGPSGDMNGMPPGKCAVQMAKAGADLVGINCQYDPDTCLETVRLMKKALDAQGLNPFLMLQPVGFHCPESKFHKMGYHSLPEYPFALEPRLLTRWDVRKFARKAHEAGVRYLGGCCGFEPYHIREMAVELTPERGFPIPGASKHTDFGEGLKETTYSVEISRRFGRDYWENIKPATGRPDSATLSTPDPDPTQ